MILTSGGNANTAISRAEEIRPVLEDTVGGHSGMLDHERIKLWASESQSAFQS